MTLSMRSNLAAAALSALALTGLTNCDLPLGGGGGGEGEGEGGGEGEGEAGTCGGSCDAPEYTACTCGASDPCGWAGDGFCDETTCSTIVGTPFRDPDCAGGEGEGDPCLATGAYNNRVCDPGCAQPDPDCTDACVIDGSYSNRFCDVGCPQLDPDCSDACVINGFYDDDFCDQGCALPDLECCSSDNDCSFFEVCLPRADPTLSACAIADGQQYTILASATLCTTTTAGEAWDALGGAPDAFFALRVNGVEQAFGELSQDSFDVPVFFKSDIILSNTDTVDVLVYDSDATANDFMGGFCLGACNQSIGYSVMRDSANDFTSNCSTQGVSSMSVYVYPTTR